ncbi:MAG: PRC-barrel domain-containing protein [Poseidonia sp.]
MAIFGREVLGSSVMDRTGATLGTLTDIHIDLNTGSISELIVTVEASVDASALPFEHNGRTVTIPASAVARIANNIHLNQ